MMLFPFWYFNSSFLLIFSKMFSLLRKMPPSKTKEKKEKDNGIHHNISWIWIKLFLVHNFTSFFCIYLYFRHVFVETLQALHKAMNGCGPWGKDDTTLARIIVTRAEIDMQDIKAEYIKKHGKPLHDAVHSETLTAIFANDRKFLLSLLGPKD